MEPNPERAFFLQPSSPRQRQYEALRAVFVEGLPQNEVAQRFGYSYDAFRQLVSQFRASLAEPEAPPFSTAKGRAGRPARASRRRLLGSPPSRKWPMWRC